MLYALELARPRKAASFFSSMWNVFPDSPSRDSVAKDIWRWDPEPLPPLLVKTSGAGQTRRLRTWSPLEQQLRADGPSSNEKKM